MVLDSQDGIASVALTKTLRGLDVVERVDKNRHKGTAGFDDLFVAQRTVGERLATRSAGVLTEMDPQRFLLGSGNFESLRIVFLPNDLANGHR